MTGTVDFFNFPTSNICVFARYLEIFLQQNKVCLQLTISG